MASIRLSATTIGVKIMIRLMPIWIHFRELGYTDEQIENLTLKQIEDVLNGKYDGWDE